VQAQGDNLREEHMHRIVMTNEVVNDTAREKKSRIDDKEKKNHSVYECERKWDT